ncbi:MAG TPA: YeeE/YedE thiosulfate transporter family protein [Ignavibacteria bacterium]|nr:YeeE/YedE thiosulfate transporter family protein [Ignavibacteria bacterium]
MIENILNIIRSPWPWYVSGPLIGLMVPALLYFGKSLGVSGSFRDICSVSMPNSKVEFIKSNKWKENPWNLFFLAGIFIGGFITYNFLMSPKINLFPLEFYSLKGAIILIIGGFLVGFGSRYAGGCTSGHGITGLSTLQLPSLFAIISFFIGGFIALFLTDFIINLI